MISGADGFPFQIKDGKTFLDVKVTPCASKNEVLGTEDERLRVKIAAAPEDGKANAALKAFMAECLGVPKSKISLVSGEKSRLKRLQILA